MVQFDVTSLFADVSLDETNKFTPHIICIDKEEINTTFPKSEMNDLWYSCTKKCWSQLEWWSLHPWYIHGLPIGTCTDKYFYGRNKNQGYTKLEKGNGIKMWKSRSSQPEVFCKKGALKNFSKFTEKHLCQGLFFNKVAGLGLQLYLKKETLAQCFPSSEFCEISNNTFFTEYLQWLLLEKICRQQFVLVGWNEETLRKNVN